MTSEPSPTPPSRYASPCPAPGKQENFSLYWKYAGRDIAAPLALLLALMLLPPVRLFEERAGAMLQIHLLLELLSVTVALLIAAVAWQTFATDRNNEASLLLSGFLAVATIDLAHALSYDGMPSFVTENSTQKAVFFWLAGRTIAALTLLLLAAEPRLRLGRRHLLRGSGLLSVLVLWAGVFHAGDLPTLFAEGAGVTPLKTGIEYALVLVNVVAAALFICRARAETALRSFGLASASLIMAMGEMVFSLYHSPGDLNNNAGHLFKLLSYFYLYRMVFITAIRAPYDRLAAAEMALRESEAFSSRIIETAPDAILVIDERGRIVRVNDYAEQLFGYAKDELIGKPVEILLPEQLRLDHARRRSIYMGNPVVRPMVRGLAGRQVTGRRLDGSEFPVEAGLGPVQAGGRNHVIVVLRDITLRKEAEQALGRLNAELELRVESRTAELQRANREMETFSYSVAHDLRSPLRAIIDFSGVLREEAPLPPESRDLLARIEQSAQRMARQIDGLLALARLSRTHINPQAVDLSAVAKRVVGELRQIEPGREVEVRIEEGLVCHADPTLIQSVMQNLVGNAWKYTGRVAAPCIRIGRQTRDGQATFFVADNGAGFDMRYAQRLFDPFQRLHSQEEFTGIGIGLATVRRIIERHGGEIRAEAQPGAGACFYFTLAPALPPARTPT